MSVELTIRSRQRVRQVNMRLLQRMLLELFAHLKIQEVELGVTLVAAPEMARLNWQFLQHAGSTDVITFDHSEAQVSRRRTSVAGQQICGELFICMDDAVEQARSFHTTWTAELVRYVVHGVLHLCGYDDHQGAARRKMKLAEDRLVAWLAAQFAFRAIARPARKP